MAQHRIKVPASGQTAAQITVVEWFVKAGETISEGEDLVAVEVEKVDIVIPSPVSGTLVSVFSQADDVVEAGDVLCVIESADGTRPPAR
jgi:pyruvate/2-oxoglutarate dehydrogenase complex dihydrolipoamide acyltransferase (E2) component